MNGLIINISWEWALGIVGLLIVLAWRGSARFTALETSMAWVRKILDELKVNSDNKASSQPAFSSHSPVGLTSTGLVWLNESGLKDYIDLKSKDFLAQCIEKRNTNPYEVQQYLFAFFSQVTLDSDFEEELKKFAFEKGTTIAVLRRVGAIYLRDLCLAEFGMEKKDIDKHTNTVTG